MMAVKWDGKSLPPALKAHALLVLLTVAPTVVYIPFWLSIVLHASLTVYVGAWRSVKDAPPAESGTVHVAGCGAGVAKHGGATRPRALRRHRRQSPDISQ